jgi:hypothetical protein
MSRRRALIVLGVVVTVLLCHELLLRISAHGHVAHVLLAAGNGPPPIGAAMVAVALVVVRFLAVVVAPGAALACVASLAAHEIMGPPQREDEGTGSSSGAGISPSDGIVAGVRIVK